jgi:type II secretory ATPase GspE/PulE/Tfp pilus assembly ATPase PilB-like protein
MPDALHTPTLLDPIATLGAAALVSWWKPVLLIAPLAVWAWLVAKVFDKDAARFYLPRERYNAVHLAVAAAAAAIGFLLPLEFFITLPAMVALLALHLVAYVQIRNNDERVPDNLRWSMNPATWVTLSGEGKKKKDRLAKGITMSFKGPGGRLATPAQDEPEYPVRVAMEELLTELIERRGSKLEVVPVKDGQTYGVAVTVDGVPSPVKQLPKAEALAVMDMLKRAAGLDTDERRKKLRGEVSFGVGETPTTDAWVVTSGSSQGMRLTLLVDPVRQVDRKAEDLGLQGQQPEHLREIVDDGKGVVLLTAPNGHGRTTLLYAMTRAHDAYTQNIQVLELETQFTIEGVKHNVFEWQEDGAEFATTARSILRRDPDVCAIAEMPDKETAQTVARADLNHTRVYLSLTQSEPIQAIQAYIKSVGDNDLAAGGLHGVIGCRLLRRLCQNCRISYKPTPEMLKKLGLPEKVNALYRTEGKVMVKDRPETCPVCGGSGFVGQVAALAVHPVTEADRDLLKNEDYQSVRGAWRQRKQPSIQSAALQLIIKGETTVDEMLRVMQPKKRSQNPKPGADNDKQARAAKEQPAAS